MGVFGARELGLDRDLPDANLYPFNPRHARAMCIYYLRQALAKRGAAVHLFVHEADRLVRCCHWVPDEQGGRRWLEDVPMDLECGLRALAFLRKRLARDRGPLRSGQLACRQSGVHYRWRLESPHAWDVRVYLGDVKPEHLSYRLVFSGTESARRAALGCDKSARPAD